MRIIDWVKKNKLIVILGLVVVYLLVKDSGGSSLNFQMKQSQPGLDYEAGAPVMEMEKMAQTSVMSLPGRSAAPAPEIEDRLVVEESNISCLVDQVREKVDQVIDYIETKNGYLVSSSLTQPGEAPFATVVVRLPQAELRPALEYLRGLAIKVTSENLRGWDVTDEYVDLAARLETLDKTKVKFEQILDQAVKVEDILKVQRELISLQQQIDNLKGRQDYLKKTAENAKLTIYLSTDEWALPYAPEEPAFRPKVIFKQAVRSLVQTGRALVAKIIWFGVYSVVLLPLLVIWWFWKRKRP